jgi:dihydropteroate synthase
MLSLGGDAALPRNTIIGNKRLTGCVLIGTKAQLSRLGEKLTAQPFGLRETGAEIVRYISGYDTPALTLTCGRTKLKLSRKTHVMGIINCTPDSFTGDGFVKSGKIDPDAVAAYAQKIAAQGASIIDIGGESTRPGSRPVGVKEEIARVIPAIRAISKKTSLPISIDTYRPETAQAALDNGAVIINDICGLKDEKMARIASRYRAAVVIMHMLGRPRTMQKKPVYKDLLTDINFFFKQRIETAVNLGISPDSIILDPGIGFGKTVGHNLEILKRLSEFKVHGKPLLIGTSRKNFIGAITGAPVKERDEATIASCVIAANNGASIVRVHNVQAAVRALSITDAIKKGSSYA